MTSAIVSPKLQNPESAKGRTYGYVRATYIKEVGGPEDQANIIAAYCEQIGRRLDEVFSDDALSDGLPLARREGGKRLLASLGEGDHLVVARSDLMFRSFAELGKALDAWRRQGVIVHLCDPPVGPLDPASPVVGLVIEAIARFNGAKRRRTSMRCRVVSNRLEAEGRRNTRFAPFGFRWERRGELTVQVPEPNEQRLCIKAAEMRLEGYSWHQIRRYFAYEWRVKNRVGNQFGYTEIREMTFRGLELLHAAGALEADPTVRPA